MRILIVSQYFWPENFRINDLAVRLVERGHEVSVLTGLPNYPEGKVLSAYRWFRRRRETYQGVRVLRAPLVARGSASGWRLAINYLSFAFFAAVSGPFRVRSRYDVVLAFETSPVTVGIPAIVMKLWRRVPLLFWVQDLWPESLSATGMVRSPFIIRCAHNLTRWIYRRCDLILVQSEAFITRVLAVHGHPPSAHIEYVPNWAESFYAPVQVAPDGPEACEMPAGFRVLFGGNIGAAQSFETIVEAATLLRDRRDIHWIIVGDGHRRAWVEKQRAAGGLEHCLHLLGWRAPESMPRYFALADALLVTLRPDPIFDLTMPSKVQSYFACGRPIVAALNGEGRRVVESSGAGLAVASGDAPALAQAIVRMSETSAEERAKMGERARQYYLRHFERETVIGRIESLIAEATGVA